MDLTYRISFSKALDLAGQNMIVKDQDRFMKKNMLTHCFFTKLHFNRNKNTKGFDQEISLQKILDLTCQIRILMSMIDLPRKGISVEVQIQGFDHQTQLSGNS